MGAFCRLTTDMTVDRRRLSVVLHAAIIIINNNYIHMVNIAAQTTFDFSIQIITTCFCCIYVFELIFDLERTAKEPVRSNRCIWE